MPYTDFTVASAETILGVRLTVAELFPGLTPVAVPSWLQAVLRLGRRQVLRNEKTRSELIVAPILLAVCELSDDRVNLLSGERLDADPNRHLYGECDFMLSLADPTYVVRTPLVTVVEAKKQDIDAGLGQCVAQMVAIQTVNRRDGHPDRPIFGCVTTGENWQFLRLTGQTIHADRRRPFIDDTGWILAAFLATIPPAA